MTTATQRNIISSWAPVMDRVRAADRLRRIKDIRRKYTDRLWTDRHFGLDMALYSAERKAKEESQ